MVIIRHKRGDTFKKLVTRKNGDGTRMDITGWQISSKIRDATLTLLSTLNVRISDAENGEFEVVDDTTEDWPLGTYYCDIEMIDAGGVKKSSETFAVNVLQDITY